ncbi:nuclear transport factor 2 family protein [Subtercola sp. YIM 133946]|uniref:nuclear transport factor 2 family protein n=1 Tax=Subtercola sp. YIM 133946 TaxID=3118909 RepID=UPI002F93EF60
MTDTPIEDLPPVQPPSHDGVSADEAAAFAVADWINRYETAWESNEPDDIRALFTPDASYRTEPDAEPWVGHDAIVAGWTEIKDLPGDMSFEWKPLAITPEVATIQAVTVYPRENRTFDNLWVIRLAPDGRATDFTEWYMQRAT